MAKFMLIKISLMAEITDADALREAALKNFDTADMTSADHPETADWHASEEGQEKRRQIATQDGDALNQLADPTKALELLDGVPGAKVLHVSSSIVGELEGTTRREARDAWLNREGITFLPDEVLAAD
jgi:hypothetical protein